MNVQVQNLHARSTGRGHIPTTLPPPPSSSNSSSRHRGIAPLVARPAVSSSRVVDFPAPMHREVGRPHTHTREDPVRSVDKVFNVYGERLRADLRDMQGLCTQIVAQEKQEAAKWYALCAKVISERDRARRRLDVLALERNGGCPNSSFLGEARNDGDLGASGRLVSKRAREASDDSCLDARSSTIPVENRPVRSLRYSPVHSPPASPSPGLSMSPPSSSRITQSPPLSSMTPPSSSSRSEFSPRPAKLRRSCDLSNLLLKPKEAMEQTYSCRPPSPNVRVKQQPRTPSPLTLPTLVGDVASNFSHVDLMYVSAKGAFVCRACLLQKSKLPSMEPKAFPLSASWDQLRDHCVGIHPEACADVARLQPAELFELRRRLSV